MDIENVPRAEGVRRGSVVLLYMFVAALLGLALVVAGTVTVLFGAKDAAAPELGLPAYSSESYLPRDERGMVVATEEERREARVTAVEDRRRSGIDGLVNGAILLAVGLPTMIWHLRRGRRLSAGSPGVEPVDA